MTEKELARGIYDGLVGASLFMVGCVFLCMIVQEIAKYFEISRWWGFPFSLISIGLLNIILRPEKDKPSLSTLKSPL